MEAAFLFLCFLFLCSAPGQGSRPFGPFWGFVFAFGQAHVRPGKEKLGREACKVQARAAVDYWLENGTRKGRLLARRKFLESGESGWIGG